MNSITGILFGPQAALFAELFSTRVRYSGVTVSYQVGALFGGALAPIIATALYGMTQTSSLITVYMVAISVISLLCFLGLSETHRRNLAEEDHETTPHRATEPAPGV
ncbi:hypothetical protein [Sinosporangium siamense]|nr:hypothetical protein [Sinosporangium siamense]